MTVSSIKVKIQRKAVVKLKVLPRFASNVSAASPILLDRTGGNFAFGFDATAITINGSQIVGAVPSGALPLFTQTGTGAVARTILNKIGESFSVTDFGAIGNGVFDNSPAFTKAFTALSAGGGGLLIIPPGNFFVATGITIPNNVYVIGSGINSTFIQSSKVDVNTVVVNSSCGLENLSIFGKGTNFDTGTFGATNNALTLIGSRSQIRNVAVAGGFYSIYATPGAVDTTLENTSASGGYGNANVANQGAIWFKPRCSFDSNQSGITLTNGPTFSNWAATTAYTVGQVVQNGSFYIQCSVAGTSGSVAPTNKNFLVSMTDGAGSLRWLLWRPVTFSAVLIGNGSGENHFDETDFSGNYSASLTFDCAGGTPVGPGVTVVSGGVLSAPISIISGYWIMFDKCEFGSDITISGSYTGAATITNNKAVAAAVNINVGATASNFLISDNNLGGGTITVAAGASNHYRIANNVNCTVADGGTGTDKIILDTSSGNARLIGDAVTIQGNSGPVTLRAAAGTPSVVNVGVAGVTGGSLVVAGSGSGSQIWQTAGTASGTITWPAGTVNFSGTGGASQVVKQVSAGAVFTVGQLAFTDISGSITAAQLPALTGGDVTSSAGSAVLSIGANKVTRAMEAQGVARSVVGVTGNATANVADIQGSANQFLGVNSAGTALTFQSIPNAGLTNSSVTVAGQSIALGASGGLSVLTNSVTVAVAMTTLGTYYDGPSVAQGTTGTWLATGMITISAVAANNYITAKLWDGATLIASGGGQVGNNLTCTISLSGYIASPTGNLRISATNNNSNGGTIATNNGIDLKSSTISAIRVA